MAFLRALLVLALAAAVQAAPVRIGSPRWGALSPMQRGLGLVELSNGPASVQQRAALWALHDLSAQKGETHLSRLLEFNAKLDDTAAVAVLRAEDERELGREPRPDSETGRLRETALRPKRGGGKELLERAELALRRRGPARLKALEELHKWLELDRRPGGADEAAAREAGTRMIEAIPRSAPDELPWLVMNALQGWRRGGRDRAMMIALQDSIASIGSANDRTDARRVVTAAALEDEDLRREIVSRLTRELGLTRASRRELFKRAETAASAGQKETEALTQLWSLTLMRSPSGRQELWRRLSRSAREGELRPIRGSTIWNRKRELRDNLPTLAAALEDPGRLSALLSSLSLLRMMAPYHLSNDSELAPVEWGDANGMVFPLGELRIYPVSESFRRFIVTDASGRYAVELKVPGDQRAYLDSIHFTLARTLSHAEPRPLSVEPLHFSAYRGGAKLYGRNRTFTAEEPLGVMVFAYQDGKRRSNALRFLARIAERQGRSWQDAAARVDADTMEAAAFLHARGWIGYNEAGNDSHAENVRVLKNGRSVLVADFQAYEREFPDARTLRWDRDLLAGRVATERDVYKASYVDMRFLEDEERRRALRLARRRLRAVESDPGRLKRGLRALDPDPEPRSGD